MFRNFTTNSDPRLRLLNFNTSRQVKFPSIGPLSHFILKAELNTYSIHKVVKVNSKSLTNLKDSIKVQVFETTYLGITYYHSVNVVLMSKNKSGRKTKDFTVNLAKFGILLKMRSNSGFNQFFDTCSTFAAKNMFSK